MLTDDLRVKKNNKSNRKEAASAQNFEPAQEIGMREELVGVRRAKGATGGFSRENNRGKNRAFFADVEPSAVRRACPQSKTFREKLFRHRREQRFLQITDFTD